jgi:hypothetical protein
LYIGSATVQMDDTYVDVTICGIETK